MKRCQLLIWLFAFLAVLTATHPSAAQSRGGWSIGVRVGGPVYGYHGHRPHYHGYYGSPYYYPPRVIYAAPPIVYASPPVVYTPAPIVVRQPDYNPAPTVVTVPTAPSTTPPPVIPVRNDSAGAVDGPLSRLNDASETVRRDAAMELGRMKSQQAIDPLITALGKDPSPLVRDAAARGLGLIGSSRSLNALIYAAQADTDRDVRHSAQFAVEIIRTNLRGN